MPPISRTSCSTESPNGDIRSGSRRVVGQLVLAVGRSPPASRRPRCLHSDLDTHITDVVNLLSYDDLTDVVLVGWSYGGSVVAGVADHVPERIVHLFYFDSDVPRDGETSTPPAFHAAKEEQARATGDGWRIPVPRSADDLPLELSAETRR
jgi:pimeloyl-ACP methyl ester carboxylesterase